MNETGVAAPVGIADATTATASSASAGSACTCSVSASPISHEIQHHGHELQVVFLFSFISQDFPFSFLLRKFLSHCSFMLHPFLV